MIYKRRFALPGHEADFTGRWRPACVLDEMQRAAESHSESLGTGHRMLEGHGIFWVISRIRVKMKTYPAWGEEIVSATWPRNMGDRIFPREYRFTRPDGELLGEATAVFLLKHRETGQIVRAPDGLVIPETDLRGASPFLGLGKLTGGRDMRPAGSRRPRYSDIDVNGHVNNQRYAQWVCDLFEPDRFRESSMETLQINFLLETGPGDSIALYLCEEGNRSFICGRQALTGEKAFEALCEWNGADRLNEG